MTTLPLRPDAAPDARPPGEPPPAPSGGDAALVAQALAGQPEAFDALTRRYLGLVYSVALAHLRDRDAADDLTQETFLRAYLALGELTRPERFGPWVVRIARNLSFDWLRAGRRRSLALPLVSLDDGTHGADQVADSRQKGALEQMEDTEECHALQTALAALEAEDREIVLLHYSHDLPAPEIAARLGIHRATARRRLDRAVATLRAALAAEFDPAVRRAAGGLRPGPAAEAGTLAVAGAVALLSTPAKAALVAQLGASTAVTAATASVATSWYTLFVGSLLADPRLQIAAAAVVLALVAGVVYRQAVHPRQAAHPAPGPSSVTLVLAPPTASPAASPAPAADGAPASPDVPGMVVVTRLVLVDAEGRERAVLATGNEGARFSFLDDAGNTRTDLGSFLEGEERWCGFRGLDANGHSRFLSGVRADGTVSGMYIHGPTGAKRYGCGFASEGNGGMTMANVQGHEVFGIGMAANGAARMYFQDAGGNLVDGLEMPAPTPEPVGVPAAR